MTGPQEAAIFITIIILLAGALVEAFRRLGA